MCFLLPSAGTVPAAFLAGSGVSSQSDFQKALRIRSTWQSRERSRPFGREKGRHVGCDSGFALISTVTFQKAGTPNSNKSFPEYFWRHRGGAGLCGWVWLFLVFGIIFFTDKNFHWICEPVSIQVVCPHSAGEEGTGNIGARDGTKRGLS